MKLRGRPPKLQPEAFQTATKALVFSSTTPAENSGSTNIYSQLANIIGQCWFIKCDEGNLDIDLVALWCSGFYHFSEWQTKPKKLARKKVLLYEISKGHPKIEGCEFKKNQCPIYF